LGKTVKELLALLDSRELSEWQAFFRIEQRGAASGNQDPEKVEQDLRKIFGRPD
jgi:hypothetical protein